MQSSVPDLGPGDPEMEVYESPAQLAGDLNVSLLGALERRPEPPAQPLSLDPLVDPGAPYDGIVDRIELLSGRIPLRLMGCIGLADDLAPYRLAANLAVRLAARGRTVTVVDANLDRATLAGAAGAPREGLMDMLLYGCSFHVAAQASEVYRVRTVLLGSHPWSGEPIHADDWERVLTALREHSDLTLLVATTDLDPAILSVLARRLDSIVLGYELTEHGRDVIRRSYLSLWDMDAPVLGVVTEGQLEASQRSPGAGTASAVEVRPAPSAPPVLSADWARKFWDPTTDERLDFEAGGEVVIRENHAAQPGGDAQATAFWSSEVERILDLAHVEGAADVAGEAGEAGEEVEEVEEVAEEGDSAGAGRGGAESGERAAEERGERAAGERGERAAGERGAAIGEPFDSETGEAGEAIEAGASAADVRIGTSAWQARDAGAVPPPDRATEPGDVVDQEIAPDLGSNSPPEEMIDGAPGAAAARSDDLSLAEQVEERLDLLMSDWRSGADREDSEELAGREPDSAGEAVDRAPGAAPEGDVRIEAAGESDARVDDGTGEEPIGAAGDAAATHAAGAMIDALLEEVLETGGDSAAEPAVGSEPPATAPAAAADAAAADAVAADMTGGGSREPDSFAAAAPVTRAEFGLDAGAGEPGGAGGENPVPVVAGRTPWRVLLIGGIVGIVVVMVWAYQNEIIRFEQWAPQHTTTAGSFEPLGALPGPELVEEGTPDAVDASSRASAESPAAADAAGVAASETISSSEAGSGAEPPPAGPAMPPAGPAMPPAGAAMPPAGATPPAAGATPPAAGAAQPAAQPAVPADQPFSVHVSSFRTRTRAETDLRRFIAAGYAGRFVQTEIPGKGTWYRVYVGYYATLAGAREAAAAIRADKLSDFAQARRLRR